MRVAANLERALGVCRHGVCGQRHDGAFIALGAQLVDRSVAIELRHLHVHQHDLVLPVGIEHRAHRGFAVAHDVYASARPSQHGADEPLVVQAVFGKQHANAS